MAQPETHEMVRLRRVNAKLGRRRHSFPMRRRTLLTLGVILAGAALVAGCATSFLARPQRAAWRGEVERRCVASGAVKTSSFVKWMAPINGPAACGMDYPFRVSAVQGGYVPLNEPVTLDCAMIPALDIWMARIVQPASLQAFGIPVVKLISMGGYSCRGRDGSRAGKYSEHSFGNAIDIAGFVLADGRRITILKDWRGGTPREQWFLRTVHNGGCRVFKTVIGPDGDGYHQDHLHMDLARHNRNWSGRSCS
ncbi:extensin family protein [Rhizobiales bacterium Sp-1]|uniref:Extensin family protein n=2 Tax=Segnochrobactrum spirostomi TaxID=2608987 RepID=A0A6A7XXI1_9HYPH|nr:extensin family protein [Segnochrobactrum spirostomi]